MNKQLFEEALADVKKVKQIAEDNAKRDVVEAVIPRIRELIDRVVLQEFVDDEVPGAPGAPPMYGEMLTDFVGATPSARVPIENAGPAASITPPDDEGKVTLDLDALASEQPGVPVAPPQFGKDPMSDEEFELSAESFDTLKSLSKKGSMTIDQKIRKLSENINLLKNAGKVVRSTPTFRKQIAQMISNVENTYDYVQEQLTDPTKKLSFETMLESNYRDLNKLQESMTMSQKTKMQMNEADVTLKLTGLPDDIDLDTVGVDLITGAEDGEGDELDLSDDMGDDQGDDQGGDQGDMDDLDLDMGDDQGTQMETRHLSDDTIVEIDESLLRREIARMRSMREAKTGPETKAQSWGHGSGGANILDDFGGGDDEGEPLDAEIVDKTDAIAALPLGEADESCDDEEMEELDESQATWRKRHSEAVSRLTAERKFQARAKSRASFLKQEAARNTGKRLSMIKSEYATVARRFNESVGRAKKISQLVAHASQKLQESRLNSGTARSADQTGNALLRKKLAETNLYNAKLLYTNKLLQNDQLSSKQKAQVIKQIDTAKTVREARLVYNSVSNTLDGAKTVTESRDREVLGSGSRATRAASTTMNEGHEAERWAKLAGIIKS